MFGFSVRRVSVKEQALQVLLEVQALQELFVHRHVFAYPAYTKHQQCSMEGYVET